MPPRRTTVEALGAKRSTGRIVCATSVTAPAVPMSKEKVPLDAGPGEKEREVELSSAPLVCALQIFESASTPERCWACSPGFGLPARILDMLKGVPSRQERAHALRRIWPPPSRVAPSISSMR